MKRQARWLRTLVMASVLGPGAFSFAGQQASGKRAGEKPATRSIGEQESVERAMKEPPAPARKESHEDAASQKTAGGTRSPPVGVGSNKALENGANADVGNSTGAAAKEGVPHMGTPRR